MKDQGYDDGDIAKTIAQSTYQVPTEAPVPPASMPTRSAVAPIDMAPVGLVPNIPRPEPTELDFGFGLEGGAMDIPDIDLGLTDEDITYLRLKWGKTYRQEEWVTLE